MQLSPRLAPAHSNLASALKEQGQVERALAHYRQAISLDPYFADAHSESMTRAGGGLSYI